MKTEQEIKKLFNQALSDMKSIKSNWESNGNNYHGWWYEQHKTDIQGAASRLQTLRDILGYYSNEPFTL